jgi:hypothetical protein
MLNEIENFDDIIKCKDCGKTISKENSKIEDSF